MKKYVEFTPGYDEADKGHGIHGVELRFVLKKRRGAVVFLIFTNWFPKTVRQRYLEQPRMVPSILIEPLPTDVGYHSRIKQYEGQATFIECKYSGSDGCYYDGSGLRAYDFYDTLTHEGERGVWRELESYHEAIFGLEWYEKVYGELYHHYLAIRQHDVYALTVDDLQRIKRFAHTTLATWEYILGEDKKWLKERARIKWILIKNYARLLLK